MQAVKSYSDQETFNPAYCYSNGAGMSLNTTIDTCCRLYNSTDNFNLNVDLCDCRQFCPNKSVFGNLSDEFCSTLLNV